MNSKYRFMLVCLGIFLLATPLFAGGGAEETIKGPIVVASKIDTEGVLLGSIIVQLLEANGFEVDDRTNFGTTDVIRTAITSGEIDIYPEYTGNGAFFFPGEAADDVWKDPDGALETVARLDRENNNLVWLEPGRANNTWAIALRQDLADAEGLETMSDMGAYIARGGTFKLAASEEFVTRPDALPSFQQAYNFELVGDQLLTFSGGNTALTEQAAASQTDGVNAAMAYGTDGQLAALGLRVMIDDKNVQPVYEPAPLVRQETLDQYPEIADILRPVFQSFSLEILQALNSSIAVEGRDTATVVSEYLTSGGFIN